MNKADLYMEVYDRWVEANPRAVAWLDRQAIAMNLTRNYVSARYLVEKLRYEPTAPKVNPVHWVDWNGKLRTWTVPNVMNALISRCFKDMGLKVVTQKSMFD